MPKLTAISGFVLTNTFVVSEALPYEVGGYPIHRAPV
jgi:hypothetical protein